MMVTDIESLPRGGMGGVVHTVGTAEDSEQKISQTKLILKCPLSKEFAHIVHINYIFTWKVDRDTTNCQDGQDAEEHLTIIINQTKQGNCICSVCLTSAGNSWYFDKRFIFIFCLHNMFPPFALSISISILCLNHQQSEELVEANISNHSTWVIGYEHINMLRVQTVQVINLKKTHPRQSHPSSHSHLHIVCSRQNLSSVTQISHMMRTMVMIVMSHITNSKFPRACFHQVRIGFHDRAGSVLLLFFLRHKLFLFMESS